MTPLVLQTSIIQGVYGLRRTTVPITKRSRASCWTEEHPSPHIAHYTRMQKKKHLQEELMAGVKLEEKTAAREKADVSMGWNKVAAGILKKSDDGRRQSKPDLSDLPKRPITADPTKPCLRGQSSQGYSS
ncbi:hypothetical protein C0Q70_21073 [Pomacea canaliculata]|uniref:Uncharacterized protein n=1 Tax=Pomacea canaliculata TaxID=400727 RepID=A0A2T7NBH4_POMCA|nr:hypothetical protein C0Q70_21073 [Pomacea canaliculata]